MVGAETGSKMKAILSVRPAPASRLRATEVDRPALTDDGVLVRVRASSANPVDLFPTTFAGYMMGGRKPVVLGTDFAGTVEATGKNVTELHAGDEVFGGVRGAFAELLAVPESGAIVRKPAEVSFELAGTIAVAGTTALQALRDHGRVVAGRHVLVNGASGGVGTFAVQIARALGAEVTAVCSGRNAEMVRSLGADEVIDYTKEDFTRGTGRYDLILDVAGTHSLSACKRVMKPDATFVGVGAAGVQHARGGGFRAMGHFLSTRAGSIGDRRRVVALFIARLNKADLAFLGDLVATGKVTPAIDRRYDMDTIGDALQVMYEGHARAKIAIAIM